MHVRPGREVDRYRVEALLGEGGMAVVYRVRHLQLDTRHALKVLTMSSRKIQERLIQEGKVQASLRHPNVVQVTDIIDVNGSPGLVMEYIAGPTLDALIKNMRLELDHVDALTRGILAGVQSAHEQGVLHRDLKPANILLAITEEGLVPKVADFGLAKLVGQSTGGTRTGATMGTPSYMAPEQVEDAKAVDARADVFSLGAILYELVTGHRAFDGENIYAILCKVKEGDFVPPQELVPDLPPRMLAAIHSALKVDPSERVQSVAELQAIWRGNTTSRRVLPEVWDPQTLSEAHSLSEQERLEEQSSLGPAPADGTFQLNDGTERRPVSISATGPVPIDVGTFYQEQPNALTATPTIHPHEDDAEQTVPSVHDSQTLRLPEPAPAAAPRWLAPVAAIVLVLAGIGLGAVALPMLSSGPEVVPASTPKVPVVTSISTEPPEPDVAPQAEPETAPDSKEEPWANTALPTEEPTTPPIPPTPSETKARTAPAKVEPKSEPTAPAAPAVGSVQVKGDVQSASLVSDAGTFSPGEVPVGSYSLQVVFPDGFAIKAPFSVDVTEGVALTVKCSSVAQNCAPPK